MNFFLLGISHQTAPVSLREQVTFDAASTTVALMQLRLEFDAREAILLSTCNRSEIYGYVDTTLTTCELHRWLADFHQMDVDTLQKSCYFFQDRDVITHTMRLACGLNSQVLGETQIQSQMKQALTLAQSQGMAQGVLGRLFERSFSLAKYVRQQTEIGQYSVSVAYTSVCLAKHVFGDLQKTSVLLLGSGQTIELVATHLKERQTKNIFVANRTLQHARELAEKIDGQALELCQIKRYLHQADIVISATASPSLIIQSAMIKQALVLRRRKPILCIDLAVPRDIDPAVDQFADTYLYTVDDLNKIVEKNIKHREDAAKSANIFVEEAVDDYLSWYRGLEAKHLIVQLRRQAQLITEEEIRRAAQKLERGVCAEMVLSELSHKLTKKLLHAPTKALRSASQSGRKDMLAYLVDALGGVSKPKVNTPHE